ncbi:MAG: right-handed parallel beta-helix repeat-containing protein, partial [Candidatus Syntrophosphaera sp.]
MKRFLFLLIFTLACLSAFADTDVSGSQSGTWNLAGSPYNVIGDITIPSGSDLLIMPGVQVVVMGDYQITAEGTLTATGTVADSIFFYNGQAIPEALWGGIRLENEVQMSNIQFCYLEKAEIGVNSINSPCNISYNRFTFNEKALQLYGIGDPDPATVQVDYNIVEYSIQNGILVTQNSNAVIENNEIRHNGTGTQYRGAIQLSNQSQGGSCSPLIQNNHIHHNLKQGITAWDIYGDNGIHPQILENVIEYNLTGIYLLNSSGYVADNIIRHNFIPGDANSGAGVMVAGGTSEPYFERNEIYGNFTGFYLGNNAQPCLGNLSIYHDWAQGENEIYDNIDESNTLH